MLFLLLCGFVVFTTGCFVLGLALLFVLMFCNSVITLLGEEIDSLCASRAIVVYFASIEFCHFSLSLGAKGWLRLVLVALPGLF